jgi:hypothetical protein
MKKQQKLTISTPKKKHMPSCSKIKPSTHSKKQFITLQIQPDQAIAANWIHKLDMQLLIDKKLDKS